MKSVKTTTVYEINYFDNKWEIEQEVTRGPITKTYLSVTNKSILKLAKDVLKAFNWPVDVNFIIRYYEDLGQGVAVRMNNGQFRRFRKGDYNGKNNK